jgi:glycosidase
MNFSSFFFERAANILMMTLILGSCAAANGAKKTQPLVQRTDPPFWWVGMQNSKVELLFNGKNIGSFEVSLQATDTKILTITRPPNPDYLMVEIEIGAAQKAGSLPFVFSAPKQKPATYNYELKTREQQQEKGIDPSDLIYLVFPDRFSNGDVTNDAITTMNEKTADRKGLKTRHGGDIQGIINHIDYFEELGTGALWLNPVLENNQPLESYHGYAFTDHYKVDPRLGTNELYKSLCQKLHNKKIKVVWDVVYNHWGNEHYLHKNLPDSNWVHWFPQFTRTSYRAETLMDPYASIKDKSIMTNAWFDHHMPDLNQKDEHLATYLIQNSIWWIEYAGIDAFRIDTYAYPDQQFMKQLNEAVLHEYPDFVLFGETWVQGTPVQAWFTEANGLNKEFSSSMQGVTDFQLYYAITKGLTENFGWEEGFRRIELTLAQDILYKDAYRNVTHLDNHDLSRFYSMVNEDFAKWKMGIALLYTLRGTPSIYYGTEILMKNYSDPDAKVREDFSGGWPGDASNKFTAQGRTEKENEAFNFCKTLGQWRRNNAWFGHSKLTQFVPENNTYVYFRQQDNNLVMCVYNGNDTDATLDLSRFAECMQGRTKGTEIISGARVFLNNTLTLAPKSVMIYELVL